jgi:hypothetical protein
MVGTAAATDLIATLPSRIVLGLAPLPAVRVLTPPLPDVEVTTCLRCARAWNKSTSG